MKSLLIALIVGGTFSLVASAQAADAYPYQVETPSAAPRPYYRSYSTPIPYRVYRPVYRPYAHGGRQGTGYYWGFPWGGVR